MRTAAHAVTLLLLPALAGPLRAAPVITDVTTDKARYRPQEPVTISVRLDNRTGHSPVQGTVRLSCGHWDAALHGPIPKAFRLGPGASGELVFHWTPPARDFQGYRVEAQAFDSNGHVPDRRATAVDVSSTWTRFPRYGFLSAFPAQPRRVSRQTIRQLDDFHLNGLQFYDWQYTHQQPLAGTVTHPAASWQDIAGRPTSRQTVLDLIHAAHDNGMAAMNYNLLYGAWSGYGGEGVDARWGLWKNQDRTGQDFFDLPGGWGTPKVYLFNPADAGWQNFLFGREADVFAAYPFDGWQVDQLGDRGSEYDFSGRPVTVWRTFRPFLNAARSRLGKTILFNNVGGYGLYDTAAHSAEDAVYVECWERAGQRSYDDLKTLLGQASSWSGGKGVVLAAYMDRSYAGRFSADRPGRFNRPGVLLTDATIFANGGSHIELGDGAQLLDNEYFPNRDLVPDDQLRQTLRGYYDFLVAYENLLRGGLADSKNVLTLSVPSRPHATPGTVWAFAKTGGGSHVLHLINLMGEKDNAWRDDNADDPAPTPQTNIAVNYHVGAGTVKTVNWASPDAQDGGSRPLAFMIGTDDRGHYVRFTVPTLTYWDMIYLTVTR